MRTAKQLKLDRQKLERELRADLRRKDRERLAKLRSSIKAARTAKRERLRAVRDQCQADRLAVRDRGRQLREQLREALRAARQTCTLERQTSRERGATAIEGARGELREERSAQRTMRRYAKPATLGPARPRAARASELRHESDDEVRLNLGAELLPVFEGLRTRIKATPRMTRTEAFLHYLHDHPEVVWEVQEAEVAAELRRMEKEERTLAKAAPRRAKLRGAALREALAEVPF